MTAPDGTPGPITSERDAGERRYQWARADAPAHPFSGGKGERYCRICTGPRNGVRHTDAPPPRLISLSKPEGDYLAEVRKALAAAKRALAGEGGDRLDTATALMARVEELADHLDANGLEIAAPDALLHRLTRFEGLGSSDSVKRDLELTCTECGEHLCDIEHEDNLETLARMALDHQCGQAEDDGEPRDGGCE